MAKKKQKDFEKVREKVGKKLKRLNETTAEVKTKKLSIAMKTRPEASEAVSIRGQTLRDLLTKLGHPNEGVRKENLVGLRNYFQLNSAELAQPNTLLHFFERIPALVHDEAHSVRRALVGLLGAVVQQVPASRIAPFMSGLVAHVSAAMTQLTGGIRIDSLDFIKLLLTAYPRLLVENGQPIFANFLQLIAHENSTSRTTLSTNGKLASQRVRLRVLTILHNFLRIALSDNQERTLHAATNEHKPRELRVCQGTRAATCLFRPSPPSFATNSATDTTFLSPARLGEYLAHELLPILIECWLETNAAAAAAAAPAPGSSGTHASLAALMQYQSLYELFVREDATVYFADHADAVEWDGKLGPASKDLLYQFAISNNITDAQQKAVRFAVLAQFYTKCGLDLPILAAAVKDLTAVQASAGTALQPLQPLIASSGQALITDIYRTLDRLHTSLGVNEEGASDFAEIAIIISGLVKLHVAASDIVNENVRICFENAFVSNFSRAMQASQPTKDYAGRDVVQSIKLVRALTQDVKQAALLFQPTAAKFEWDVTQSAVVVYDRNLQKFIEPIVAKYSKIEGEISPTLFELYYSLRAWEPEARSACPVFTSKIDVCELFFPIVRAWIEFSSRSSHAWVEKAVQLDTFTPVTDDSLISSSVIDVFRVVSDTWEFCVGLKWPVTNESAYIIAQHACITVCSCVGEYVRILIADLKAKGYHDADGQFDIAPSLCIVLNNLYDSHVRMKALEASVMDYLTETANGRSLKDAGNSEYFNEVCSTVNTELLRVTRAIAAKMRNDFAAWALKQVYNDAPAPTTKAEREAFLKPLLDYLDGNLSVLGQSCHADVFALLLEALWNVLMTGMGFVIAPSDPKMRLMTAAQHARAKALVEEMYNFFHDNGDGLAREKLETEQYAYVQELLGYSSPIVDNMTLLISKLLAEHYDSSRTSQQRGRIEYEIAHDRAAGTLSVKIVKCTNLVAMDDNGLSDPFVQVSILSPTAKPSMKKTSTKKKNLNPEFNETLVLPLTTPLDQSAVRLDVFDWDLATKNDHIGEVWVYLGACGGRVHETRFLQGSTVQHQRARDYLRLLELHKVAGNKIARSFLKSIDVVAGKEEAGAD
eukprot:m.180002 g.180002  ORF g.180002 m.180002 type:complete len:1109 (+) comp15373_c1_seq3:174-3500(+)